MAPQEIGQRGRTSSQTACAWLRGDKWSGRPTYLEGKAKVSGPLRTDSINVPKWRIIEVFTGKLERPNEHTGGDRVGVHLILTRYRPKCVNSGGGYEFHHHQASPYGTGMLSV